MEIAEQRVNPANLEDDGPAETLEELAARVDKVALAAFEGQKHLAGRIGILSSAVTALEEAADAYREEIDHLKQDKELLAGILTRVVQAVGEAGLLEDVDTDNN